MLFCIHLLSILLVVVASLYVRLLALFACGVRICKFQGAQESIPRNRFCQPMQPGGPVCQIGWESISGLLIRFTNSGSEKRKGNVIEYMIGSKEEGPLLQYVNYIYEIKWIPVSLHAICQGFLPVNLHSGNFVIYIKGTIYKYFTILSKASSSRIY